MIRKQVVKRCNGCSWLRLNEPKDEEGNCMCEANHIRKRHRRITDKACKLKSYD